MKVFDIDSEGLKVNENCFLIPEFKAILDKYEDPVPALAFCHFMTHPDSPYHNLEIDDKERTICMDVGGDFTLDDEEIENAVNKLIKLYETPIQGYYEGQKQSMHIIGRYLKTLKESSITTGREGNLDQIIRMQKEAGKTMESFLKLEKLWREQVEVKLRGSAQQGEY